MDLIGKRFLVQTDTKASDLKPGDLVVTAEIHRVEGPFDKGNPDDFLVTAVLPICPACKKVPCAHRHVMSAGRHGQQSILKIINPDV